jgi:hypothetical protein
MATYPGGNADEVPESIRRLIAMLTGSVPGFNADFNVKRADPAFAPFPTQRLSARLSELTGNAPGTISFGSEADHLGPLAEETTVFGPGDMTVAHRTGEFVAVVARMPVGSQTTRRNSLINRSARPSGWRFARAHAFILVPRGGIVPLPKRRRRKKGRS